LPRFFAAGYKDLYDKDFFQLADKKIPELNLADRLNLYFKIGLNCRIPIPFAPEEQHFVDRMKKLETFDDVLKIADELAEQVKQDVMTESRKVRYELADGDGDGEGQEIELSEEEMKDLMKQLAEKVGMTDKQFKKNLEKLVDYDPNKNNPKATETVYSTLPTDESFDKLLKHIVVDYKNVHEEIDKHYQDKNYSNDVTKAVEELTKFQQKNNPIIMYLIKQFEMKKSCEEHRKTLTANTGIINTNKLYSYKFNDNIFFSKDIVPEGKNHGLVMFFDCSGSMDRVFSNLLKQTLVLVLFCKRLNIPFEVYGYSDNSYYRNKFEKQEKISGTFKKNEVRLSNVVLKNYFSSRMKYNEFYRACVNIFCIINYYTGMKTSDSIPASEQLSGTPLNSAMAAGAKIVADFRAKYKIEKVNTILLTDGMDESGCGYSNAASSISTYRYDSKSRVLTDPKTRKQYKENCNISSNIFNYFKDKSNTDLIWFYLTDREVAEFLENTILPDSNVTNIKEVARKYNEEFCNKNSCIMNDIFGANDLYMIKTESMEVKDIDFDKVKKSKNSVNTLIREITDTLSNKVILNRFIDKIA